MKRLRLLRFLKDKIAKTPDGELPPKWLRLLHNLFFPLKTLYAKKSEKDILHL